MSSITTRESPPLLSSWINLSSSLTTALRSVLPDFKVQVLFEGIVGNEWQRDVYLCDGTQPYVFARTTLPATSALLPALQQLGCTPLGEWLYAQTDLIKQPTTALALDAIIAFLDTVSYPLGSIYIPGRYTRYCVQQSWMEVREIFLEIPLSCQ